MHCIDDVANEVDSFHRTFNANQPYTRNRYRITDMGGSKQTIVSLYIYIIYDRLMAYTLEYQLIDPTDQWALIGIFFGGGGKSLVPYHIQSPF